MKLFLAILLSVLPVQRSSLQTADSLYRSGFWDDALSVARTAETEAVAACDTSTLIKALCIQVDCCLDLGDDDGAHELYNRCFDITGYGEPLFFLSSSLYNLALIYDRYGCYDEAEDYARKSVDLTRMNDYRGSLSLKTLLIARIHYDRAEYEEALSLADEALDYALPKENANIVGRIRYLKCLCEEALQGDDADLDLMADKCIAIYEAMDSAFPAISKSGINPYLAEVASHIGQLKAQAGRNDEARQWFERAIETAGGFRTVRGNIPDILYECSSEMASLLQRTGDPVSKRYEAIADSMSFLPYVYEMSSKLSLNNLELVKREKDKEIDFQKEHTRSISILAAFLAVIALIALITSFRLRIAYISLRNKNAQLIKLSLQKDTLVEMVHSEVKVDPKLVDRIEREEVPLPEMKLSPRELQVVKLMSKGLLRQEISEKLGISADAVAECRQGLFAKLGVSTTAELVAYAYKAGIIG